MEEEDDMIRRITGIVLGVLAFLLVFWITGLGTPSQPNWALAALVGLVVFLLTPRVIGLFLFRRARQRRQDAIDQEVAAQRWRQENNPPSRSPTGRARRLTAGDLAHDEAIRPQASQRRAGLPAALARPDDLGLRRPDHAARAAAGRRPHARGRRLADGAPDRRRAVPAPALLAA